MLRLRPLVLLVAFWLAGVIAVPSPAPPPEPGSAFRPSDITLDDLGPPGNSLKFDKLDSIRANMIRRGYDKERERMVEELRRTHWDKFPSEHVIRQRQEALQRRVEELKADQRLQEERMIQRYINGDSSLAVLEIQLRARKNELVRAQRNHQKNDVRADEKAELAKKTVEEHPRRVVTADKARTMERTYRAKANKWQRRVELLTEQVTALESRVNRIKAGRAAKRSGKGGPGAGAAAAAAAAAAATGGRTEAVPSGEATPSDSRRSDTDRLQFSAVPPGVRSARPRPQMNSKAMIEGLGRWAQQSGAALQHQIQHPPRLGDVVRGLVPPMPPRGIQVQPARFRPLVI